MAEDRDVPLLLQAHQDRQIIIIGILFEGKVADDGGGDSCPHPFLGLDGDHLVLSDFDDRCPEGHPARRVMLHAGAGLVTLPDQCLNLAAFCHEESPFW